jgi:hypothetical protein
MSLNCIELVFYPPYRLPCLPGQIFPPETLLTTLAYIAYVHQLRPTGTAFTCLTIPVLLPPAHQPASNLA